MKYDEYYTGIMKDLFMKVHLKDDTIKEYAFVKTFAEKYLIKTDRVRILIKKLIDDNYINEKDGYLWLNIDSKHVRDELKFKSQTSIYF